VSTPTERRDAGGGLVGGVLVPPDPTAVPPRTVALRRLRALHAEAGRLRLRRIEVRVELDARRRAMAEVESAAASTAQGPVEAAVLERSSRAASELAIEARRIEQRLYRLKGEIAVAQARAVSAVLTKSADERTEGVGR
jgi:hypothetical protein